MSVKEILESALKQAMKDQDEMKRNSLRLALSTLKLAEVDAGKPLDDLAVFAILQKEIKTKEETLAEALKAGRDAMAQSMQTEINFLKEFLPKELSESELTEIVKAAINETGAASIKDMGRVMKIVIENVAGRAPNDRISKLVRELLPPQ
jgi:Uncharacterized conserved protein